jgi:hypothetical protein
MSDNKLYGITDSTPVCEEDKFEKMKKTISNWLTNVINSKSFKNKIVDIKITEYHKILIIKCSLELLNVVYKSIDKRISIPRLQTIGAACFIISVHLLYGFDNIDDRNLFTFMKICNKSGKEDASFLEPLVYDILKKTDWKGCDTFLLKTEHRRSPKKSLKKKSPKK